MSWSLDEVKEYHVIGADGFRRIPHPDSKYRQPLKSSFPDSLLTASQRWVEAMGEITGSRSRDRPRLSPATPYQVTAFGKIQEWHLDFLYPAFLKEGKLLFWWSYYQLNGTRRRNKNFKTTCRREGITRDRGYYVVNVAALKIAEGLTKRHEPKPQILER